MTVAMLITANSPDTYTQCTLSLDTLRVGFPTVDIQIDLQADCQQPEHIRRRARLIGASVDEWRTPIHHGDWIRQTIARCDGPLVIVDPDCIFWENCEHFGFSESLLAGVFVPDHWNHWGRSAYRSRLHTSFLWINDPAALLKAIPRGTEPYLPFDPFRPVLVYDYGRPTFYDTLAILCHALPKEKVACFTKEHLNCYDHLNSASFFHQMQERWDTDEQRAEFARIHDLAKTDPTQLRGLWRKTQAYYEQQHKELLTRGMESAWDGCKKKEISGNLAG